MEYYLTILKCIIEPFDQPVEVTQLVKASSRELASDEVKRAALEESGSNITIISVRVHETLIGR